MDTRSLDATVDAAVPPAAPAKGTSAVGGSARSQAHDLDENSWKPRPVVGLAIVAVAFLVPVGASIAAVQIATRLVVRPASVFGIVVWVVGLAVLATVTMWAIDHLSRRLLPLAAMLRLSLVFPDSAPSRFSIALRSGSGKSLERSLERASTDADYNTSEQAAALVVGLIGGLSKHDRLTRGHSERVRAYADLIGEEMDLDAESRNKLHWAALLHDIGKRDVPAAILNKTERLTDDEWKIIRGHPGASERWIEPVRAWLGPWARAASEHHERYDGDGYPNGLAGDDISLAGRIVAVADAFDVMTAARSYKKPYPAAQARVELANNVGTQFDPKVVRAFLSISLRRLRLVMGPLAWLSSWSGMFSLGTVASAGAATLTAALVAATAFAAPASAGTQHSRTRSEVAGASARSSSDGSGSGDDGSADAPVGSSARGARSQPGGSRAKKGSDGLPLDTVPVTPIGPSDPGVADGSGGAAPGVAPITVPGSGGSDAGRGGGGGTVTTTPGDTAPGNTTSGDTTPVTTPGDTTPVTTPGGTTPDTTPGTTPATTPVTSPVTTPVTVPPPVHHAPVANNDTTGSLLKANVAVDVLHNDFDVDGNLDPSTLALVSVPSRGPKSITVSAGKINVRVALLYTGTFVFTYRICDTTGLCSQASVTASFTLAAL